MSTDEAGPTPPYPALADGLRAANETAARLWRTGADALAAQAAAIERLPLPDPAPGIDQYFELLRKAAEANQQLATQWAAAVQTMTDLLGRPDATSSNAASTSPGASPSPTSTPAAPGEPEVALPVIEVPAGVPDGGSRADVPATPADVTALPGKPTRNRRTNAGSAPAARRAAADGPASDRAGKAGKAGRADSSGRADRARQARQVRPTTAARSTAGWARRRSAPGSRHAACRAPAPWRSWSTAWWRPKRLSEVGLQVSSDPGRPLVGTCVRIGSARLRGHCRWSPLRC